MNDLRAMSDMQHLLKNSVIRKISRKSVLTISAISLVVATAASGGIVIAHHGADSPELPSDNDSRTDHTSSKSTAPASDIKTNSAPEGAIPDQSSASTDTENENRTETTVTVNGQTTHTVGDASIDKSYTTDDGAGHVSVSIHNSSSQSVQGTNQNTEKDMN
jgi:cytoskeletal protein RodZ